MCDSFHYQARVLSDKLKRYTTQKCDAKYPCTTCINAHRAAECEYKIGGASPGQLDFSQPSLWDGPSLSSSEDGYVHGAIGEVDSEPPVSPPLIATRIRLPPEMVPPACAPISPLAYNSLLSSYTLPGPQHHTFNEIRTHEFPRVKLPPLASMNCLASSNVPPGAHVTLGAGRFQLSDAALGDLNMKLYVS